MADWFYITQLSRNCRQDKENCTGCSNEIVLQNSFNESQIEILNTRNLYAVLYKKEKEDSKWEKL